ncbi:MAG: hypothetical protein RMY34_05365 [Aulosira sp. DedQUE10]|nr:hypothetical protein [Aulosira sp. DedQUE10]
MESLVIGAIASLGAKFATVIGALAVLLPINFTQRVQGIMLGFGGGVMLAATPFLHLCVRFGFRNIFY